MVMISNSSISGNVTAAGVIQNSFNVLHNSETMPEVKQLLEQLLRQVEFLKNNAPTGQQEQIVLMLTETRNLIAEITRREPRNSNLQYALESIREAATRIGAIGQAALSNAEMLMPFISEH